MSPLFLQGKWALSNFRVQAILNKASCINAPQSLSRLEAEFVYLVETAAPLRNAGQDNVLALLGACGVHVDKGGFYVTPRKGTISPWSSKATDIFHNCGMDDVILRVERGIEYRLFVEGREAPLSVAEAEAFLPLVFDRMTEGVYEDLSDFFLHRPAAPLVSIPVMEEGLAALEAFNARMGLAISEEELAYLYRVFSEENRNPTDVEIVMFGQVNSEHCRHKIFNAEWVIDGEREDVSLFGMIRNTFDRHPEGVLSAYKDNSAVMRGWPGRWFELDRRGGAASPVYGFSEQQCDILMKVETHNHPTAISPYPGASTGVGGEIRDEGATGVGGKSKAGLAGFMVSNLRVPGFVMPWERDFADFPDRLATPLEIMTDGPLGGAAFGNEFGRPQLCGLFKTFEERYNGRFRGYHKPIMLAGGMGNIRREHVEKRAIPPGCPVLQIGGPAMRIGLGGGAASSMDTGANAQDLDFDSVQRDNAEMERRCQEVIDACMGLGDANPILSIHDIGAGGLSNGCPELVSETGATFDLRAVHNEEQSMSPMEIWCCEAQERYVLATEPESLQVFMDLCARERCPVAVIGMTTDDGRLRLEDPHFGNRPIDMDLKALLGQPPKMVRDVQRPREEHGPLSLEGVEVGEAAKRVLQLPAVARKTFLITITDRSITGLVARDQMVGPWQTPVADVAVTATGFQSYSGEAMAMGERTKTALVSGPASGRMAVAEAITNIAAASIGALGDIRLSANWMAPCNEPGEDAILFDTVRAVGMEFCPALGISIPVGKDSLSMRSTWECGGERVDQSAPLSLVISAFAPVEDVRETLTPDLKPVEDSALVLVDLGRGRNRLGGASALAQVYNRVGGDPADMDSAEDLKCFFAAIQKMRVEALLLAYHDRSDGGLFVTLAEMAFAGRRGFEADLDGLGPEPLAALFSEEAGAVLQVAPEALGVVREILEEHGLADCSHVIGKVAGPGGDVLFRLQGAEYYRESVMRLNRYWSELTWRMQALRDNPACADEEYESLLDAADPGISYDLTFDGYEVFSIPEKRPPMAILREQGINGQVEMAAAFHLAGFDCRDVHMTDLLEGRVDLQDFAGLVACGGFSYGDVLGAGSGWAKSVLYHPKLKDMFATFFAREDTFALGVCNGCQMLAQLKEIIPGAEDWPFFGRNRSERFEARFISVKILPSPSIFFRDMAGSRLAIPVAHGEGRMDFDVTGNRDVLAEKGLFAAQYVDHHGEPTERYPLNPNGSEAGMTALTTPDGRVTAMMPHPERVFRSVQLSYAPREMLEEMEDGPWMRMFHNARKFVG